MMFMFKGGNIIPVMNERHRWLWHKDVLSKSERKELDQYHKKITELMTSLTALDDTISAMAGTGLKYTPEFREVLEARNDLAGSLGLHPRIVHDIT